MLHALTALIWDGSMDPSERASLTECEIRSQFLLVSKTCDPGTPRRVGCTHSCCAIETWRPPRSKTTALQLPVPASMAITYWGVAAVTLSLTLYLRASGLTTVWSGSPLRKRSTCLATMTAPLVVV